MGVSLNISQGISYLTISVGPQYGHVSASLSTAVPHRRHSKMEVVRRGRSKSTRIQSEPLIASGTPSDDTPRCSVRLFSMFGEDNFYKKHRSMSVGHKPETDLIPLPTDIYSKISPERQIPIEVTPHVHSPHPTTPLIT